MEEKKEETVVEEVENAEEVQTVFDENNSFFNASQEADNVENIEVKEEVE